VNRNPSRNARIAFDGPKRRALPHSPFPDGRIEPAFVNRLQRNSSWIREGIVPEWLAPVALLGARHAVCGSSVAFIGFLESIFFTK
jgi:hypothetical protein